MKVYKKMAAAAVLALALAVGVFTQQSVSAHCQIPCGIYDDGLRFGLLKEHVATIEKSIVQIQELSADPAKNAAQIARWAVNKDQYADEIATIISTYFLQQRVKPVAADATAEQVADYTKQLTLCHEILVNAMKAKQNVDKQYTEKLAKLVEQFQAAYTN